MTLNEATAFLAQNLGEIEATDGAGNKVRISAINGDEVTYRVIRRGRPKFLTGKFTDFTFSN